MKNKFIKLVLAGVISTGVLASSSSVFAANVNGNFNKGNTNKNIVLLAQKGGLKDGRYNVSSQTLKEKSEELSMAGQYIDSNAVLDVQGGKMFLTVKVSRNDWMKNIRVFIDGASVNYKKIIQDKEGKVATIRFAIPSKKPNIKFKMNVVPMGNADVAFRVVLNDDITKISGSKSSNNSKNSKVNSKTKSKANSKSRSIVKSKNNNREELPQTGSVVSSGGLLMVGGASTLIGAGVLKKRK